MTSLRVDADTTHDVTAVGQRHRHGYWRNALAERHDVIPARRRRDDDVNVSDRARSGLQQLVGGGRGRPLDGRRVFRFRLRGLLA